jgi:anti-sigma factor RsiW
MAEITRLHGSAHEQVQRLLPWYNNRTLDTDEAAKVEAHLAECAECRDDATADAALARQVAALPLDTEHGWAVLAGELDREPPARTSNVALFRRRVPVGWMIGGQAVAAMLVAGIFLAVPTGPSTQTYHALASAPTTAAGNAVVVFRPETSEAAMRSALLDAGARVVGGPNVSGAYVLQLPGDTREVALKHLKTMPQVVLAEPIGGSTRS